MFNKTIILQRQNTVWYVSLPFADDFVKYGLLTKREVKMAGYWPSSCFACLWTETRSRSINTQKQNEQAWSLKDLLYGIKHRNMICVLAGQSPYPERAK